MALCWLCLYVPRVQALSDGEVRSLLKKTASAYGAEKKRRQQLEAHIAEVTTQLDERKQVHTRPRSPCVGVGGPAFHAQ